MIVLETVKDGELRHRIELEGMAALYADVPVRMGGDGKVPEPHDYFDMSLAACQSVTVMLYARAKKMDLQRIHTRISRDDSQERRGCYGLNVTMALEGSLSEPQRQRLLEIAQRSPIHKLMTSTRVAIETQLA